MIKIIHRYLRGRWERYYLKSHWHLVLDLSLVLIIIMLAAAISGLYFYRPNLPWLPTYNPPTVDLNNPPLEEDFSATTSVIKLTDGTDFKITFENNGAAAITNLTINLGTTNKSFLISKLASSAGPFVVDGRELKLDHLSPGESGEAVFHVNFNSLNTGDRIIKWRAEESYTFGGQIFRQNWDLPDLTIAAELSLKNAIYYTSPQGDQLGIGPVPPIAGIPTSYWIFWEARGTGDFKNLVVSAHLPQGVGLTSRRSLLSGEFTYNASARQIIWKVPDLKGRSDSYRLGFEIEVTPTTSDIGHILTLLNNSRYSAIDTLTGENKNGLLGNLTSNLETDHFNSGSGQVQSQ